MPTRAPFKALMMEKLRLPDTYCPMRIDDSAALLDDQIELTIAWSCVCVCVCV